MHVPRPRRCARGNLDSLPDCLEARHRPVENGRVRQAVASWALVPLQAPVSPRVAHQSRRRCSAASGPRGPSSIRASSRNR